MEDQKISMYNGYPPYTAISYGGRSPYHMDRPDHGVSSAHDEDVKNFKRLSTDCGLNVANLWKILHNSVQFGCKDLDELLFENSPVPSSSPSRPTNSTSPTYPPKQAIETLFRQELAKSSNDVTSSPGRSLLCNGYDFDPAERTLEELKPQSILKRARKVFVCQDNKDEKYWNRRKKNTVAAKRSRDARRVKEYKIAMRASIVEKENDVMKVTIWSLQKENTSLKQRVAKYEATDPALRKGFIEETEEEGVSGLH